MGQGVVAVVHSGTGAPNQDSQIFLLHKQVPALWGAQQFGCEAFGLQSKSGPDCTRPHSQPYELISQNSVSQVQLPEVGQARSAQQRALTTVDGSHTTPFGATSSLHRHWLVADWQEVVVGTADSVGPSEPLSPEPASPPLPSPASPASDETETPHGDAHIEVTQLFHSAVPIETAAQLPLAQASTSPTHAAPAVQQAFTWAWQLLAMHCPHWVDSP